MRFVFAGAAVCAVGTGVLLWQRTDDAAKRTDAVEQIARLSITITNTGQVPPGDHLDPWGTPLAVFVMKNGEFVPAVVRWAGQEIRPQPTRVPVVHQIISAGPDGTFGTADDVHSYDPPPDW